MSILAGWISYCAYIFLGMLFCSNVSFAKMKPENPKICEERATCVIEGSFSNIQEIKIENHPSRPTSSSVGTFKILKRQKTLSPACMSPFDEVEIIFSTGHLTVPKGYGVEWEENFQTPTLNKRYKIYVAASGVIVPSCLNWLQEVR